MSDTQKRLQQVTRMLFFLEVDELESHLKESEDEINMFDSLGSIIDPTGWIRAKKNGDFENAKIQMELVGHLLEARKTIAKLDPSIQLQILSNLSAIVEFDDE